MLFLLRVGEQGVQGEEHLDAPQMAIRNRRRSFIPAERSEGSVITDSVWRGGCLDQEGPDGRGCQG